MVIKEVENQIRFLLFVPHDTFGHFLVNEQALLTGDGMATNDGMYGGDAVATDIASSGAATS